MTPAELLALIDDYGQRMLHIGALPGSAHGKPTGDESKEANDVYAKIKQAVERPDPGDDVVAGVDLFSRSGRGCTRDRGLPPKGCEDPQGQDGTGRLVNGSIRA